MGSATLMHFLSQEYSFGGGHWPTLHHRIMFHWPAAQYKPISHKSELHLCTIVSTTGWPLSGYASNWIRGAATIACTTPWLHLFTLYCAYSLIHSHTCTLCVCLYECLHARSCVFWEVKLVQFSERGQNWSRDPRGLRGPRVHSSAHNQAPVPARTEASSEGRGLETGRERRQLFSSF